MDFIKKVWIFIVFSSKDPKKISATVKWAGFLVIPYIMQTIGVACGLGLTCIGIDQTTLEQIAQYGADVTFHLFTLIGFIGMIYAAIRKVIRTIKGDNQTLNGIK
jgi:hypothetical protein